MNEEKPIRGQILDKASAATLGDRNKSYGEPYPNMDLAGKLKTLYSEFAAGKYCEAHDEAIEMILTKISRIAAGASGHTDNYVDGAAYFAIAAECQTVHMRRTPTLKEHMEKYPLKPKYEWTTLNGVIPAVKTV